MIDFFKNMHPQSELLPLERKTLYELVRDRKPKVILEIGTGCGYGSTYYIAKSILDNNINSKIYTCDPGRGPDEKFINDFPFVEYKKVVSTDLINYLLQNQIKPDFLMFDGPEDPNVALNDINKLEPFIEDGCILVIHDFEVIQRGFDGGTSTKSKLIRPYIESSKNWKKCIVLSGVEKNSNFDDWPFDSVGLGVYEYKLHNWE